MVYFDGGITSSAADRDRDDFGAAGLDCQARLFEIAVLAGADQQT
jgi:hypothetical protein